MQQTGSDNNENSSLEGDIENLAGTREEDDVEKESSNKRTQKQKRKREELLLAGAISLDRIRVGGPNGPSLDGTVDLPSNLPTSPITPALLNPLLQTNRRYQPL